MTDLNPSAVRWTWIGIWPFDLWHLTHCSQTFDPNAGWNTRLLDHSFGPRSSSLCAANCTSLLKTTTTWNKRLDPVNNKNNNNSRLVPVNNSNSFFMKIILCELHERHRCWSWRLLIIVSYFRPYKRQRSMLCFIAFKYSWIPHFMKYWCR